ncbi:NYN domain-containing protein [Acutalibacter muris]|uniref:NYN domain-containing protein n=1 Tax=Acutalibacter muris TaxID=1796620 RepID=UPI001C3E8A56|nr:NYN domain-containing protein [Acutalibacter muris]
MFWSKRANGALAFVDYEYWYVSMKNIYHAQPDLKGWCQQLRDQYQVESIRFFGNFLDRDLADEVTRIREVSNDIIETNCDNDGRFMKDMSDVIMLDAIYRAAAEKRSPNTFVLFTGDGHFQPVVRYLVQELGKRVELYGVRASISRVLREAASVYYEIPAEDQQLMECFRCIVADFNRIALNHDNPFATYQSLVTRVSKSNNLPKERVEMAVTEMVNRGYITKKKHRVAYDKPMINVLIPEWDELIAAGLHRP